MKDNLPFHQSGLRVPLVRHPQVGGGAEGPLGLHHIAELNFGLGKNYRVYHVILKLSHHVVVSFVRYHIVKLGCEVL